MPTSADFKEKSKGYRLVLIYVMNIDNVLALSCLPKMTTHAINFVLTGVFAADSNAKFKTSNKGMPHDYYTCVN